MASAGKGQAISEWRTDLIVQLLKAVRADETAPTLQRQFLAPKKCPQPAQEWADSQSE